VGKLEHTSTGRLSEKAARGFYGTVFLEREGGSKGEGRNVHAKSYKLENKAREDRAGIERLGSERKREKEGGEKGEGRARAKNVLILRSLREKRKMFERERR